MKRVTLDTIAKEIGTTKNTVSRAIRGKSGVSDELRNKINDLAAQYGYQKKKYTQKAQIKVTMVCNSSLTGDIYFWPSVMKGIFEYSARHQISINSVIVDIVKDDIKYLLPLQEEHCDGILIVGTLPDAQFARIAGLGIPMVMVDHYSDVAECDFVNTANAHGMVKAVDFLAERGHQKIGFINNEAASHVVSLMHRYQGYKKRMEGRGLTVDSHFVWPNSCYTDNRYFKEQLDMLDAYGDAPTAWICVNDLTAYNFCSVLKERGLRIPEDVSVIGFDNIPGIFHTPLTTMEIPQSTIGRRALRKLMRRLNHPEEPFEYIEIFTRLVDRGSVKRI